jgi:hypothetical protein
MGGEVPYVSICGRADRRIVNANVNDMFPGTAAGNE